MPNFNDKGEAIELLYSYDLPNVPDMKLVSVRVTYAPGGYTPTHTHGNAYAAVSVLEGGIESHIEGEEKKSYRAGETFAEEPGKVHITGRNTSDTEKAVFIATFVLPRSQKDFITFDCERCRAVKQALSK